MLRSSVRALQGLPVFTSFGFRQKHASLWCALSRPRPFEVAPRSALRCPIRSPRSGRVSGVGFLRVLGLGFLWGREGRGEMGWACAACTFVNDAGSACGVCCEPAPGAPSSGDVKWACDVCTFVNVGETAFCEVCDTGRPALTQPASVPSASAFGTSFRPLRASARLDVGADSPIEILDSPEEECVVTGHTEAAEGGPSGSTNPKSRKRNAKEAAIIDLFESRSEEDAPDVKDGKRRKENEEDPNHLLKNLHKERMARMNGVASGLGTSDVNKEKSSSDVRKEKGSSDVKQEKGPISASSSSSDVKEKGVVSLSSLSREQKLAYIEAEGTWLEKPSSDLIVLSYNVWFREDLELQARLEAIGDVILEHRPHIVFFQEVTEDIYKIFQRASWWKSYDCSVKPGLAAQRAYFCMQLSKLPVFSFRQSPFRNSVMGRELCLAELDAGKGARLLVATSHLESPCPAPPTWNQMFSPERVVQAKEAMSILKDFPNVVFGGDMNWDDKKDGPPPLPAGWIDAWLHLRPGQDGFTYDTKANRMLSGQRSLRKRLDRMFCRLRDFEAVSIEMVGTEAIPDLTYSKEKKVKGQVQMITLPVLPSDHFGLLLKLCRKSA
jgi:tyrosyl-DNA phosphodiesterase 2